MNNMMMYVNKSTLIASPPLNHKSTLIIFTKNSINTVIVIQFSPPSFFSGFRETKKIVKYN